MTIFPQIVENIGIKAETYFDVSTIIIGLILLGRYLEAKAKVAGVAAIPVIILSNLGQREDVERGMKLGAKDYLVKAHFTPNDLIAKVQAHIG